MTDKNPVNKYLEESNTTSENSQNTFQKKKHGPFKCLPIGILQGIVTLYGITILFEEYSTLTLIISLVFLIFAMKNFRRYFSPTQDEIEEREALATYVWIAPKNGKVFHLYEDCGGRIYLHKITLREALENGYSPCSRCWHRVDEDGGETEMENSLKQTIKPERQDKRKEVAQTNIQNNPVNASPTDEIMKLKQLLDENIITQEEFDQGKKKILGI